MKGIKSDITHTNSECIGLFWLKMKLSKEAVEEFRKIWQMEFGELIPESEASERAIKFMNLFKIVYQPISKENEANNG